MLSLLFGGEWVALKYVGWCALLLYVFFRVLWPQILFHLKYKKIDLMSGEEFEEYVAYVLIKRGFREVALTAQSNDFGIDVIAHYRKIKYAVQVKRYSGLVGLDAVQEAYAGAAYYEAQVALVITNSEFTSAAQKLADSCNVILVNREAFFSRDFAHELHNIVCDGMVNL